MIKYIFILLTIVFVSDISVQQTKSHSDPTADLQRMTDSLVNYFHTKMNVVEGGMFLKVVAPKGNYFVSSGINPPPAENSHFRIASNTKTFTAASIMLLYQEGKLNIDDYITGTFSGTNTTYLPETPDYNIPFKTQMTIKQLLQHRAGVFDVTNTIIPATVNQPYTGQIYYQYIESLPGEKLHTFTFDELIGVVSLNDLYYFKPGEDFHYSNTGYNILGKIIERASGMSYSDFVTKRFIEPLQLTNTIPVWKGTDITIPSPQIQGYMNINDTVTNTTEKNMSEHVAEGNLISTPEDLAKWIKLLITGRAGVSSENVALMKIMHPAGPLIGHYGLGLVLDKAGYGHDGGTRSYISFMRYNPENDITIIMLCNFIVNPDAQDVMLLEFAANVVEVVK